MTNKKLLFISIPDYDLYKIFEYGFEKFSDCDVTTILYKNYKYKNSFQKILNFFSKTFLGINLKKRWETHSYFQKYISKEKFDYVVVLSPYLLTTYGLNYLKKISRKSIVYYWDGFDHFPEYIKTLPYFDSHFTFDPVDAKKYNLKFITNFYFSEEQIVNPKVDIVYISAYDNRFPLLEKIIITLEKQKNDLNIKVYQFKNDNKTIVPKSNNIIFIDKSIPMKEANEILKNSKIILDIQKNIQIGLTFRVFEAIGFRKKLITTNKDIVNYDFYTPNNIFIWTDETTSIPNEFLTTPYQELPIEIYKKYSQENWVKTLLEIK